MRLNLHVSAGAVIFSTLFACSARPPEPRIPARPVICTTNYPLQYFTARIAGGLADVRFPAPAGTDPAYWEPDTATIEAYQNADLTLLNGAGYEKWLERASLPPSRLVNTSASFEKDYIPLKGAVTHSHGPEGEHTHGGFASTIWLDPQLAQKQANSICDALVRLLPERRVSFEQNFRTGKRPCWRPTPSTNTWSVATACTSPASTGNRTRCRRNPSGGAWSVP